MCRVCGKDRKSTRLNSSHLVISYAVFCLKKKIHGDAVGITVTRCDLIYPEVETALVRKAAQEVNVLLVDEEIRVVDCNWRVRAGSQTQRLNFRGSVVKIGRQIGNLCDYVQSRCLSPDSQGSEGCYH